MLKLILIFVIFPTLTLAGPTKVGNGDDGSDLEQLQKVESGILLSTKNQAIEQIEKLNVRGIKGLGNLQKELQHADLYIVKSDVSTPKTFDSGLETSPDGKTVYARTFAQPYSPVRFFPAALLLSEEQLVRLHIHEALHRSLPESLRENESIVSEITLAISAPSATRDSIELVVAKHLKEDAGSPASEKIFLKTLKPSKRLLAPSLLRVSYQSFHLPEDEVLQSPISSLMTLDSFLYPFGGETDSLGVGISVSALSYGNEQRTGPLGLSLRQLLNTWRGFDIEAYGEYSMYTFSDSDLKNVSQARDVGTVGLTIRKETDRFYTENFLSFTFPSEKEFKLGNVSYKQDYAPLIGAKISGGYKPGDYYFGGSLELLVTDGANITSESFESSKSRMSLTTVGLEGGLILDYVRLSFYGKTVLDSQSDRNLNNLGDLLGHGAGQGLMGTSLSFNF